MPNWVLENAGTDTDVISFGYPAKLWQKSSLRTAAQDLDTWLKTEYRDHRHIVFVTHSTGGLVLKQLFREEFRGLQAQGRLNSLDLSECNALWLRSRQIVHIAVPHYGGSRFMSWLAKTGYYLGYMVLPLLRLATVLTQGDKDWGHNQLLRAVQRNNPWLLELDRQTRDQQQVWDELGFPQPRIQDIVAGSDMSVPESNHSQNATVYFRGTHKTVKIPRRPNGPIVGIVGDLINGYRDGIGLTIADKTLARINDVNKATATNSLIAATDCNSESDMDRPLPVVATAVCGTQFEICEAILTSIHKGAEQAQRLVLTGTAGTGKSAVMRAVAWRLAHAYLNDPTKHPLPLFIPLQQIGADHLAATEDTWQMIWQWWGNWVTSLYPDKTFDPDWLADKMQNRSVSIILDGLDDFLINQSGFGLAGAVKMLREVNGRYKNNHQLSIIVSIRNSWHGIDRLATGPEDIFEILRLSRPQAMQLYPACSRWLSEIENPELLDQVLTPLILTNYAPDKITGIRSGAPTQAALMRDTIHTFLARTNLVGVPDSHRGDDLRSTTC